MMERRTNKLSNSRTPWLIMVPTKLRVVQTLSKNTIPLLFTVFWECHINMKIKSSSFPKHGLWFIWHALYWNRHHTVPKTTVIPDLWNVCTAKNGSTLLFIYTNSRITQQVLNPMSRDIYYLHACRVIVTERYTLWRNGHTIPYW